jgi:hypothetical protein
MPGQFYEMIVDQIGEMEGTPYHALARLKPFLATSILEAYLTHRCTYTRMNDRLRDVILYTIGYSVIALISHEFDELDQNIRKKRIPSRVFIKMCFEKLEAFGNIDAVSIISKALEAYDVEKWRGYDEQGAKIQGNNVLRWRIERLEPTLFDPWTVWIEPRAHFLYERMIRAATYAEFMRMPVPNSVSTKKVYLLTGEAELQNLIDQEPCAAIRDDLAIAIKRWKRELP